MIEKVRLSDGKEVFIKSGKVPRMVYPITKDTTRPFSLSNIDWKSKNLFHGWKMTLVVVLVVLASVLAYRHDTVACRDLIENPAKYGCYGFGKVNTSESQVFNIDNLSVSRENLGFGQTDNLSVSSEEDDDGIR